MKPNLALIVILFILMIFHRAAAAKDWPQWRGPNRDGLSDETGLLKAWPEGGPPLLWEIGGFGLGDGSIVTQGDRFYIQGTQENRSMVFSRDRDTGESRWVVGIDRSYVNGNNPGPSSTPTLDEDRLYALSGYGTLVCVRADDGELIWSVNLPEKFKGRAGRWGFTESPLVEGNHLIISPGGPQGTVAALDKHTGELIWRTRGLREPCGYASAIAVDLQDLRVIVHFTAAAGVGIDATNGNLLWRYTKPANRSANAATPVFNNGKVFYSSAYGTGGGLLEVAVVGDRVLTRQAYFNKAMKNHFGGVVLVDRFLYGSSGAILTCMEFETGKVRWQDRAIGKSAITYADGRLYLVSDRGQIGLVGATPRGYELHGSYIFKSRDAQSRSVPVISNGKLYVRNGSKVLCFDVRKSRAGGS